MITSISLFFISIIFVLILILSTGLIIIFKLDAIIYELSNITIIKENKE